MKNIPNRVFLCADIGTSALKAAFINRGGAADSPAGKLAAFRREAYHDTGMPAKSAGVWEDAFYRAVKNLYLQTPDARVEAVCVSGNGPSVVPISAEGELPVLHWFSPRIAAPQEAGNRKHNSFFLPSIAYFHQNSPELYKKTKLFLSCQEWLSTKLGAEPVSVLPSLLYRPYYYDEEQCAAFSIDWRKFPPFAPLGSIIGRVSTGAARKSGLTAGAPIVAGGADFIMALLGSGTISPGLVCDRAGSSEGINVCVKTPPPPSTAAAQSLRVLPHAIEGLWNVSVVLPESGSLFDRYRIENHQQNLSYEETLQSMVGTAENGALILHPVLRKILDGVLRALEKLRAAGYDTKEMRHSGGQAKSLLWNQIKARACGCRLLIPEITDTELAGNAAAIMLALDESSDIAAACEEIVEIKEVIGA
jgi:sugar (pentulose or hexulose) kinase